eukprot:CAMPEP_0178701658 /NCGR_PEP_ID=MMETSP0699-20121125/12403_1 /TAXON_ID=265572 /ORGANISM="Extubocellulus spinifer, Strain CCMP396" /LENGTH=111 /DNA_ID=CAMNT_0020348231 /DNA_START=25 /DNA_END=360 /DNA_ORIENTATION=-
MNAARNLVLRNRNGIASFARRNQSSLSQSTVESNGYKVMGLPTLTTDPRHETRQHQTLLVLRPLDVSRGLLPRLCLLLLHRLRCPLSHAQPRRSDRPRQEEQDDEGLEQLA